MMIALAPPTMMRQGYSHGFALGVISASVTLSILIPSSLAVGNRWLSTNALISKC